MNRLKFKNVALLTTVLVMTYSCGQKQVTSNSSSTSSNPISTSTPTSTSTPISGCDGIYRSGASNCYYKNLPEVTVSGPGTYGTTLWSSSSDLSGTGISQNQFVTDATFSVRMIPSYILDKRTSKQGRVCTNQRTVPTKVRLSVMLRKSTATLGEVATLNATYNGSSWSYSNTYRYSVPGGTTDPYIIEVIGVQTNQRCLESSPPATCATEPMMDIPVVVSPNPTPCIGFKLQMATDETYDLPN